MGALGAIARHLDALIGYVYYRSYVGIRGGYIPRLVSHSL